jgi:hypothetical protein
LDLSKYFQTLVLKRKANNMTFPTKRREYSIYFILIFMTSIF